MSRSAFIVQEPTYSAIRALNYSPYVEAFRRRRAGSRTARLRDLVREMGPSYLIAFTRVDCSREHGIHLLSQTDVFAAEPEGRIIRRDSMRHPEKHQIKKWQVLISGTGQMGESTLFGRSVIADGRLGGHYVGPDTLALTFHEEGSDLNLYTYAFLGTKAGLQTLYAYAYGTSIPRLRLDLLGNILVPLPEDSQLQRIASSMRDTAKQRERCLAELQAARGFIEEVPGMQEALHLCNNRRVRCIVQSGDFKTLSAWRHASTGGAIELLRRKWKTRLKDAVQENGIFYGPRFARIPCERPHGVDLYSQRDVFLIRPKPRRIVHPGFSESLLRVPKDTLLVAGQGTTGEGEIFCRVCYVDQQLAQGGFTQHLLRILPQQGESATVYGFLSTHVGFRLLRSAAAGTKLMGLREDLLLDLPYPDIGSDRKAQVEKHLKNAVAARVSANTAEAEAARIIEQEVLPAWLS